MMRRFLTLLCLLLVPGLAGAGDPALDPSLRVLLSRPDQEVTEVLAAAGAGRGRMPVPLSALSAATGDGRLEVLLESSGSPLLPDGTMDLVPIGDRLYAARLSLQDLRRLVESGSLAAARLSRPVFPTLDQAARYLELSSLRRQDPGTGAFSGITGRGVTVGIVDSGVDWSHPDFNDAEGNTRIFRYWDQTNPFGTPPSDFRFGQEYRNGAIDHGVAGGLDSEGHGTHVLGIATGSGRASFRPGFPARYAGVAPEATVIAVRTIFTEFGVTTGAQYVFDRARLLGQPLVLNLSLGNHFGPHRGTTLFERSLNDLVEPGKLIVAAAGNDGSRPMHAEMRLDAGEVQTLVFDLPTYDRSSTRFTFLDIEGWFHRENRYRFTVIGPQGNRIGSFGFGDLNREFADTKGIVRGWYTEDLGMGTLTLEIEDNAGSVRLSTGEWKLEVEALAVGAEPDLDFWIVSWTGNRVGEDPEFKSHVDHEETIISPATARSILAVGAVSTRACWTDATGAEACYPSPPGFGEIAFFSALGPTPDGRPKPEILAPGFGVVSTRSAYISEHFQSEEDARRVSTPDGYYWVNQGTSMAAPAATGAVALLLQKFPELTFEQLVSRFQERGTRIADSRNQSEAVALVAGEALAPVVTLSLSDLTPEGQGLRLRWYVGKERAPAEYLVYKGFSDEGPYHLLSGHRIAGGNPYTVIDNALEPGRTHVYRIAVVDPAGLVEDLDTLRTGLPGLPTFVFRAPDPNPARTVSNLRFYLPPTGSGGDFWIDVLSVSGRRVARIETDRFGSAGEERVVTWDLRDDTGRRVPGGMYLVRLTYRVGASSTGNSLVRRVVVLP